VRTCFDKDPVTRNNDRRHHRGELDRVRTMIDIDARQENKHILLLRMFGFSTLLMSQRQEDVSPDLICNFTPLIQALAQGRFDRLHQIDNILAENQLAAIQSSSRWMQLCSPRGMQPFLQSQYALTLKSHSTAYPYTHMLNCYCVYVRLDAAINFLIPATTLATPQRPQSFSPRRYSVLDCCFDLRKRYRRTVLRLTATDIGILRSTIRECSRDLEVHLLTSFQICNNFANVGSVGQNLSGSISYSRAEDCDKRTSTTRRCMTTRANFLLLQLGTLLVRDLVKNNGSDLAYVQNLVKVAKLTKIPQQNLGYELLHSRMPLSRGIMRRGANVPLAVMDLLANLLPHPAFSIKEDVCTCRFY